MSEQLQDAVDRSVFASIPEALEDVRDGKIILVVDDADRENEGDFIIAAEKATPEAVNFMVTYGRGIVCLPAAAWRLDELGSSRWSPRPPTATRRPSRSRSTTATERPPARALRTDP